MFNFTKIFTCALGIYDMYTDILAIKICEKYQYMAQMEDNKELTN